jgi:hypothetical protein
MAPMMLARAMSIQEVGTVEGIIVINLRISISFDLGMPKRWRNLVGTIRSRHVPEGKHLNSGNSGSRKRSSARSQKPSSTSWNPSSHRTTIGGKSFGGLTRRASSMVLSHSASAGVGRQGCGNFCSVWPLGTLRATLGTHNHR